MMREPLLKHAGTHSPSSGAPEGVRPFFRAEQQLSVGQTFLSAIEAMSGGHSCPPESTRIGSAGQECPALADSMADKNVCPTETHGAPSIADSPEIWRHPTEGKAPCRALHHTSGSRSRRAFTLLEVLATLVLVGIVVPVAMEGISISVSAAGMSRRYAEAASLAEMKLNELVSGAELQSSGAFGEDWPDYQWASTITDYDTDLIEIHVEITWKSRGQDRSVTASTLLYQSSQPL